MDSSNLLPCLSPLGVRQHRRGDRINADDLKKLLKRGMCLRDAAAHIGCSYSGALAAMRRAYPSDDPKMWRKRPRRPVRRGRVAKLDGATVAQMWELYRSGASTEQLAQRYQVPGRTVGYYLRRYYPTEYIPIAHARKKSAKKAGTWYTEQAWKLYRDHGYTNAQLGTRFGVTQAAVSMALKKAYPSEYPALARQRQEESKSHDRYDRDYSVDAVLLMARNGVAFSTIADHAHISREMVYYLVRQENDHEEILKKQPPWGKKKRKLSDDQARAICVDPRPVPDIVESYNVSSSVVHAIKQMRCYSDVTYDLEPVLSHKSRAVYRRSRARPLTDAQARAIHQDARSMTVIATDYGISPGSVHAIKVGLTYRDATLHLKPAFRGRLKPRKNV